MDCADLGQSSRFRMGTQGQRVKEMPFSVSTKKTGSSHLTRHIEGKQRPMILAIHTLLQTARKATHEQMSQNRVTRCRSVTKP